jgi:putative transcription antitermination factor YqgF
VYQRIASMMGEDHFRTLGMKAVGRLDFMSEGLLLLTNDGILKRHLEMPSTGLERKYKVQARGGLNTKWLDYLGKGAYVKDPKTGRRRKYRPIGVDVMSSKGNRHVLNVSLTEGKTREIRIALAAGGMSVNKLMRIGYGPYSLGSLEKGSLREIQLHRSHRKVVSSKSRAYHTSCGRNCDGKMESNTTESMIIQGAFVSQTDQVQSCLRSLNLTKSNDIASMIPDLSSFYHGEDDTESIMGEDGKNDGINDDYMSKQQEGQRRELLCLDVGTKRTGIALSNVELGVATPLTVLKHPSAKTTAEDALATFREHISFLNKIVEEHNVAAVVVGWPLELNGTVGNQCHLVKQYVNMLMEQSQEMDSDMKICKLDTLVWDERWSSEAVRHGAKQMAVENEPKRKYKRSFVGKKVDQSSKEIIDDLAATYILQGVLEWLRMDELNRDMASDGLDAFRPTISLKVGEV